MPNINDVSIARELASANLAGYVVTADMSVLAKIDRGRALQIQAYVASKMDGRIAGYKVAAFSDDLIWAPVMQGRLLTTPASLPKKIYGLGGVECELAFHFSKQPVHRHSEFTVGAIADAIDGVSAAIEVVNSRWSTALSTPRNAMLADMLSNAALVVGPINHDWKRTQFDRITAELFVNGSSVHRTRGGHADGDHLGAIARLANNLLNREISIQPGAFVTTGSYTGFHIAESGDAIEAHFEGYDSASVAFA